MSTKKNSPSDRAGSKARQGAANDTADAPGWADGLKQLYDSVVDEPLPDSFLELLDQFDEEEPGDDSASTGDGSASQEDRG